MHGHVWRADDTSKFMFVAVFLNDVNRSLNDVDNQSIRHFFPINLTGHPAVGNDYD